MNTKLYLEKNNIHTNYQEIENFFEENKVNNLLISKFSILFLILLLSIIFINTYFYNSINKDLFLIIYISVIIIYFMFFNKNNIKYIKLRQELFLKLIKKEKNFGEIIFIEKIGSYRGNYYLDSIEVHYKKESKNSFLLSYIHFRGIRYFLISLLIIPIFLLGFFLLFVLELKYKIFIIPFLIIFLFVAYIFFPKEYFLEKSSFYKNFIFSNNTVDKKDLLTVEQKEEIIKLKNFLKKDFYLIVGKGTISIIIKKPFLFYGMKNNILKEYFIYKKCEDFFKKF